jgi:hypothetical protein
MYYLPTLPRIATQSNRHVVVPRLHRILAHRIVLPAPSDPTPTGRRLWCIPAYPFRLLWVLARCCKVYITSVRKRAV